MFFDAFTHFFKRGYRVLVNSVYGFFKDDCYTKASVLTFYTLQSIVPVLAFILALAKGFGLEEYLEKLLTKTFSEHAEIMSYAIQIAHSMLNQIEHGLIVGVGVALLIWANLNLLGYIELSLNDIWKIRVPRSYFRRFTDYLGIIILFFLLFIVLSSLTVYAKIELTHLKTFTYLGTVSSVLLLSLKLTPLLISWILFFCLYYLMPNANLKIGSTLIAAIIAGTFYQGWQLVYINFQSQLFNYNVVYGAFAVLPLFLIWLQFSWLIVLWGAEISENIENDLIFERSQFVKHVNRISQKQLGLLILYPCLKTFYSNEAPMDEVQIAKYLKVPLNLTQNMIRTLVEGGILTEVNTNENKNGYHPLYDPSHMSIKHVCDVIDRSFDLSITVEETAPLIKITDVLNKLDKALDSSYLNLNLYDLLDVKEDITNQ